MCSSDLASHGAAAAADANAVAPFERLLLELRQQSGQIDDQARHILLETAFRVACADGTIEAAEEEKLQRIATALGISEGVLELEINAFRLARQARPEGWMAPENP